jgi:hypothetical protein
MAITDYASLKTTVADYLHRSDMSDDALSTFVQLGESRLNRKLRLLQQEATEDLSLSAAASEVALPTKWIETIDVYYADDKRRIMPQNIKGLNSQKSYDTTTGRPYLYATSNGKMLFEIVADAAYSITIDHFEKWDISTDDTNWLLTNAPDAYLYAALLEAKAYIKNMQDVTLWSQGLQASIDDLNQLDNRTRRNAGIRMESGLVGAGRFDINRGY